MQSGPEGVLREAKACMRAGREGAAMHTSAKTHRCRDDAGISAI